MENSKHVKFLFSGKNVKPTCLRIRTAQKGGGGDWGNLPRVPGFKGLPKYYKITWSYCFFGWGEGPKENAALDPKKVRVTLQAILYPFKSGKAISPEM